MREARSDAKHGRPRANQPGRPTAAELERRKARVMQVATEMFVANGYAATSLVDIARGAGVATRTLYQHFGDKEAMFREVIYARGNASAIAKPGVEDGDTLYSALMRAGQYAIDTAFRPQSIGLMRLMIAESQRFPEFMRQVGTTIFSNFRGNIEKVFAGLETAGLIPAGDHARSALMFTDLILGSSPIMTYTNWAPSPPGREDLEERVKLFIQGRFDADVARDARTRKANIAMAG